MARSYSSAKVVSAIVANAITRRGYSAASQGIVSSVAKGGVAAASRSVSKKPAEVSVGSTEKVAWGPDPVTGYYRPETGVEEIDPAELRAMLLKKN